MKRSILAVMAAAIVPLSQATPSSSAQEAAPLNLTKTVTLPGYSGDFDHFSVDRSRGRLLLAAEDHATLEIFDLKTGAHLRTIKGFGAPHSILIRPNSKIVLVTDSDR